MKETELYEPLKSWLERNGYTVHSEVLGCDIAARKEAELVLIEMKTSINLELILQVVRRQQADAAVYAAVPAPRTINRRWRDCCRLLKRLEAGLLLVYMESALPRVELAFHPIRQERIIRTSPTKALLKEMTGRTLDCNQGGSNRTGIMTAYREAALLTAYILQQLGPTSPKAIRHSGGPANALAILYSNHHGWFERIAKGVYRLNQAGEAALANQPDLVAVFAKNFPYRSVLPQNGRLPSIEKILIRH